MNGVRDISRNVKNVGMQFLLRTSHILFLLSEDETKFKVSKYIRGRSFIMSSHCRAVGRYVGKHIPE